MTYNVFSGTLNPILSQSVSRAITAKAIEMPFGLTTRMGSRNHVLDGVQTPMGRGNYKGKGAARCKVKRHYVTLPFGNDMSGHERRHFAVCCAKMAEPIDLPFLL